jgi:hypothetical protein
MGSFQDWVIVLSVVALGAAALGVSANSGGSPTVVVTTQPTSSGFGTASALFFLGSVLLVLVIFGQA